MPQVRGGEGVKALRDDPYGDPYRSPLMGVIASLTCIAVLMGALILAVWRS